MSDLPATERAVPTPGGSLRPPEQAGAARRIGSLELLVCLGTGGMGEVWQAHDLELDRLVAVKLMAPELSARDAAKRFRREARAAAAINHPHVAQVFFAGVHEDRLYYVMEHVAGRSLERRLRERGRLPASRCLDLLRQAAEGLRAAHHAGVIHRDVKPANLMVDERWQLKIVDFGLARRELDTTLTRANAVLGTPTYMAPEQARGREVDHRADIYSLGATFYHLLCGRPPFSAPGPLQLAERHVSAPLPPLAERDPDLPAGVCALVERMLAKDPARRFQTYDELLAAIASARGGAAEERPRAARRWPWAAAALLAVALAGAGVVRARLGRWPGAAPAEPRAAAASPRPALPGPASEAGGDSPVAAPPEPAAAADAASELGDAAALAPFDSTFPLGAMASEEARAEGQARDHTAENMRQVAAAIAAFSRQHLRPPRTLAEVAAGYALAPELLRDGWGSALLLERPGPRGTLPFLVSPGPDRRPRTSDDLFFVAGRMRSAPPAPPAPR